MFLSSILVGVWKVEVSDRLYRDAARSAILLLGLELTAFVCLQLRAPPKNLFLLLHVLRPRQHRGF